LKCAAARRSPASRPGEVCKEAGGRLAARVPVSRIRPAALPVLCSAALLITRCLKGWFGHKQSPPITPCLEQLDPLAASAIVAVEDHAGESEKISTAGTRLGCANMNQHKGNHPPTAPCQATTERSEGVFALISGVKRQRSLQLQQGMQEKKPNQTRTMID